MLGRLGAGDGATKCSGGLNGVRRCRSRSVDLVGLLQRKPKTVWVLEVAAALGRHGAELLEVRWCSGSDPEARRGLEHSGERRSVAREEAL